MAKVVKSFDKSGLFDYLSFNTGIVKLINLFLTVLLIVHIMGCFWYYIAKLYDFSEETWVYRANLVDATDVEKYVASIYYSFTALTTVGYGDITARTTCIKKIFF